MLVEPGLAIWLPWTMRTPALALVWMTPFRTSPTQGPAALTSVRPDRLPAFRAVGVELPEAVIAPRGGDAGAGVDRGAAHGGASIALSTTSRASSTQQSEYSRPWPGRP